MNKKEPKKSGLVILGLIALIVVLTASVRLMLDGLVAALPATEPDCYTVLSTQGGQSSPYRLRLLEEERQDTDIRRWLERARERIAGEADGKKEDVFWLYRQDTDEYILYLPEQDRTLSATDITADEERDDEEESRLVLRIRTPENGKKVTPEEQLLCIRTESEQWRGIRVTVILDGRERHVNKLVAKGDRLFSTEEVYIGRF